MEERLMSRTVVIREIKRIRKTEISKFEELTKKDIIQDYENIISLFECEYLSDKYSSIKKLLTQIKTSDGHILYIAHTKILTMCSDSLLAEAIEGEIRNYIPATYRDITKLAGQTISAEETKFRDDREELNEPETREINFKIPEKKRGVHIYFFDDMD